MARANSAPLFFATEPCIEAFRQHGVDSLETYLHGIALGYQRHQEGTAAPPTFQLLLENNRLKEEVCRLREAMHLR